MNNNNDKITGTIMIIDKNGSHPMTEKDNFFIVILSSLEERNKLYDFCISHNIPITYPNLFKEDKLQQRLWGIDIHGVGLVGSTIAMLTPSERIIPIKDLEEKW